MSEERTVVRARIGAREMGIALGVLLLPLLLLVWACQPTAQQRPSVDAQGVYAAGVKYFAVYAPDSLSDDWSTTTADLKHEAAETATLRVTYATPEDASLQFTQSNRDAASALGDVLSEARLKGKVQLGPWQWQHYTLPEGRGEVWSYTQADYTAYIASDASEAEVREFTDALDEFTGN